jgi:hypothetical protein
LPKLTLARADDINGVRNLSGREKRANRGAIDRTRAATLPRPAA